MNLKNEENYLSHFRNLSEEIPNIVIDLRYSTDDNFIGKKIPGYEAPKAFLTKEAIYHLNLANKVFNQLGYQIKIFDAYRPQRAVNYFLKWKDNNDITYKDIYYPELSKEEIFEKGYIATESSHSRGSTVDLTLIDKETGNEVDMGGKFDFFGKLSHPGYSKNLTKEQLQNRKFLSQVMQNHGFKPLEMEWWHFTLKDEPFPDTYFDFPIN